MCYVKSQSILVNFLVHILELLSFRLRYHSFLLSKLCFIIKVNIICGVGWDTANLCHKFNSQGPVLRILGVRVTCLWVSGSHVSGSQFQSPGCQGTASQSPIITRSWIPKSQSWVSGSRVSGSPGHRSWF